MYYTTTIRKGQPYARILDFLSCKYYYIRCDFFTKAVGFGLKYRSTRGNSSYVEFSEAVIEGIAPDGGLYVPAEKVTFTDDEQMIMSTLSYGELAKRIIRRYAGDFTDEQIDECVKNAYCPGRFYGHPAPVKTLSDTLNVLELWHGPTAAFKDLALQILPEFMKKSLENTGVKEKIVILTATSGDTGKAALEGFKNANGIDVIVFYPKDGVSRMQELQMVTQEGSNVHVASVIGNFDDAQTGVKKIFGDADYNAKLAAHGIRLSSANSINFGRLLPQIVYYFHAYYELVRRGEISFGEKINFTVPTGNFGNILACYYAAKSGLPVNRIICASNDNKVLADFFATKTYDTHREFLTTISPAMDILISSNFERLLFDASGRASTAVVNMMNSLRENGSYEVESDIFDNISNYFWSSYATEEETKETIKNVYNEFGYLVDPHTAVGLTVYDKYVISSGDTTKTVAVSTASPFKFNASVAEAIFGKENVEGKNEFEILDLLSEKTGLPVPEPLRDIDKKEILHKTVCRPEDMPETVGGFLCSK